MVLLTSTFLFNLLCAIVPCEAAKNPTSAKISTTYYTNSTRSVRRIGNEKPQLENEYPIVRTNYGLVQGYSMGTLQERRIFAFEGIRYAEPPINDKKFRDPIPARPWTGIYPALELGQFCLQIRPVALLRVVGSDDCLFLNIYTPELPPPNISSLATVPKLPVIIFIHGGAFYCGEAGEYGPAYIGDKDVILVTINYRLGVLGFMSTGDSVSPGNYGLKDQRLAIKWVYDNIEQFGGDPTKITLAGQSAGAVSVHLHMMNEESKKYFRAGVSISGSAFDFWGLRTAKDGRELTKRFAKIMRCPIRSSTELVHCLRRRNSAFLVAFQVQLYTWFLFPNVLFAPVIEQKSPTAFISSSPQELYDRGEVAKYPWICTLMEGEGYFFTYFLNLLLPLGHFRRHFSEVLPSYLDYANSKQNSGVADKIRKFYFGNESNSALTASLAAISQIATDRYFTHGAVKGIQTHSQIAPAYSYVFSYLGRFNIGRTYFGFSDDQLGNGHAEDIFYIFNSSRFYEGFKKDYEEYEISQFMTNIISNFAEKSEPVYTDEIGGDVKLWEAVTPQNIKFLNIGNDKKFNMIENPFQERMQFWESLNLSDMTPYKPINAILQS